MSSVSNLAIVLVVIFIVSIIALACELLYVIHRRRTFRCHSSPPLPDQTVIEVPTKELLYFFCLKPPVEKPEKNDTNKTSSDDEFVDVFEMLEAKEPSRFLCTINEEEVESTHEEEVVVIAVDESDGVVKTVFSTPCDSPMFFTPAGSPARDFMEPEFVVSVQNETDMVPD
uniref:uncharacterized protein LOC122604445 n=1 Tax=Erigeron canadensis TaxID=72917 RepID=UPI001CB913DD|nr:uncharacterized protein LOC122604445 [Erigeron canadensis]